jgi:AraC-like DNA-binding protein
MNNFYCDILDQAGVFCSFITSLILFFKTTGSQRHANRLLSVVIFAWGWYGLLYLMAVWGILKDYPHIFRIGSPLYYLIPPCSYIYVRSILYDEGRFRKRDWLHFLPAALHFIELIPFYLSDTETKRRVVEAISTNITSGAFMGSGLIPAFWHFELRALQGIIYLFFQWALLIRFFRSSRSQAFRQFPSVKGWLISFSSLISLLYLGLTWQSIVLLVVKGSKAAIHVANNPSIVFMSLSFVWLSCYLLFKPDILYGVIRVSREDPIPGTTATDAPSVPIPASAQAAAAPPAVAQSLAPLPPPPSPPPPPPPAKAPKQLVDKYMLQDYARQIGNRIQENGLFKKKGLTLAVLAEELSVPNHHLSYVLRHSYNQQFNEFINQYRVNYIKEKIDTENDWKKMTLEALAEEAGFSSRSTFFAVFKKQTGLTPSEYAGQLTKGPPVP